MTLKVTQLMGERDPFFVELQV
ncbi:hypothetical protein LINPERHAP2_LOCUS12972 [Linum perenne]